MKNLVLHKLSCIQGAERGAGQEKVILGSNGKEIFINSIIQFIFLIFLHIQAVIRIIIILLKRFFAFARQAPKWYSSK